MPAGRIQFAVTFGDAQSDFYSFPPSKRHVFSEQPRLKLKTYGFEPLVSFARGGLSEVWTGGVYPFTEEELVDYPFGYEDITFTPMPKSEANDDS